MLATRSADPQNESGSIVGSALGLKFDAAAVRAFDAVAGEVERLVSESPRRADIEATLTEAGYVVLVDDADMLPAERLPDLFRLLRPVSKVDGVCLVMVVPMLAPMITPRDCSKVIRPDVMNPTTITVVTDEDWITAVIPAPVARPMREPRCG